MTTPNRSSWRQFTVGMALYAVTVFLVGWLLEPRELDPAIAALLAIVPVAFGVWAMLGWLRVVRSFDELQRRVIAEAGLLALGITSVVTFTYGFLEAYVGLPKMSMFFVFPLIAFAFTGTLPFARKRYQ